MYKFPFFHNNNKKEKRKEMEKYFPYWHTYTGYDAIYMCKALFCPLRVLDLLTLALE